MGEPAIPTPLEYEQTVNLAREIIDSIASDRSNPFVEMICSFAMDWRKRLEFAGDEAFKLAQVIIMLLADVPRCDHSGCVLRAECIGKGRRCGEGKQYCNDHCNHASCIDIRYNAGVK